MALAEDFDLFWRTFPRRVGKLAAQKAYQKARKVATAEAITNGIAVYLANKPEYADICFPATFLNQGRWMDEAPAEAKRWTIADCPHTPKHGSAYLCHVRTQLDEAKRTSV